MELFIQRALAGLTQYGVRLSSRVQMSFAMLLTNPEFAAQVRELATTSRMLPEDIVLECRVIDLMALHIRTGGTSIEQLVLAAGLHARTCERCRNEIEKLPHR